MTTAYPTFADTEPLETEYLLRGLPRIPKGDVTLVYGDGAIGKGRLIMSWIAQVINSDPSAVVIVVLPEDHPGEQVAPRLMEAGVISLDRVVNMTRLVGGSRFKLSAAATNDGHIGLLRSEVERINDQPHRHVAMIVIDPLASCVGWGSIQSNAGARRLLEPVQDLCQDTGIAGVVVAHTVKSGSLQGSAGLSQAARVVLRVHKDPANPTVRLISTVKANNQAESEPLRYVIEDNGSGPRVIMLDAAEISRRQMSWRKPADTGASASILAALRGCVAPVTIGQLADMTGLGVPTVRTLAWRLGKRGQVVSFNGMFSLSRATA